MNEDKQSVGEKGKFFSLDLAEMERILIANASVEDLMAYMVLARGVNRRGNQRISTHGANSVSRHIGISYNRAKNALEWLRYHEFIAPAEEDNEVPQSLGKNARKARKTRWIFLSPESTDDNIYLANSIIDGIAGGLNNPPLRRIYSEATTKFPGSLPVVRINTLMAMLNLYRHQDLADCGGINPRSGFYQEWGQAANFDGECTTNLKDTDCTLYEIQRRGSGVFEEFAKSALFYIADDSTRDQQFSEAIQNLKKLGFLYETTQIWSGDPTGNNGRKEIPLYTLYIHDSGARKADPFLQYEINTAAMRLGVIDGYSAYAGDDDGPMDNSSRIPHSQRFRFIAPIQQGGFPIGIYRLRFRPNTRDSGLGIEKERDRVVWWRDFLAALPNGG